MNAQVITLVQVFYMVDIKIINNNNNNKNQFNMYHSVHYIKSQHHNKLQYHQHHNMVISNIHHNLHQSEKK
eukprot:UN09030